VSQHIAHQIEVESLFPCRLSLPQQARQRARTASLPLWMVSYPGTRRTCPCLRHSWNQINRAELLLAFFSDLVMGVLAYWHRRSLAQHSIYMAHTRVVVFSILATMAHQGSCILSHKEACWLGFIPWPCICTYVYMHAHNFSNSEYGFRLHIMVDHQF